MAPLVLAKEMPKPAARLHPRFDIEGSTVVMSTAELAGIPRRAIGEKTDKLKEQRTEIIAALDLLFTGI